MWTEEYEKNRFPLRGFLLRAFFVFVFIGLLILIISIVTRTKGLKDVSTPLQNEVFASNVEKMQTVAFDYYRKERLPLEVGKSTKLTLSDMIQKKIIVPLADEDNKVCDVKNSYVELTKIDNGYLMKINLKCSRQDDYILAHVGHYNHCETYLCLK